MKSLVEHIIKTIVDKPEKVVVKETNGDNSSIIDVTVDKSDLGKIIGKAGRTAQSIRNIIFAACYKNGKRYNIDFNAAN